MLSPWPLQKGSKIIRYQRVIGPSVEPISFVLQQAALKIGNINSANFTIQNKIATARTKVEQTLNRCLVAQVFDAFIDDEGIISQAPSYAPWSHGMFGSEFGSNGYPEIVLSYPPVRRVHGIYTTDQYGNETQVDPSVYTVTRMREPARIRINPGSQWPQHRGYEAFRIRFSTGYSAQFTVVSTGVINCPYNGLYPGDYVQFTSLDGTLPQPLSFLTSYQATNISRDSFQILDPLGNLVEVGTGWTGTGFIGEIPAPIITAMVLISGLNQAGEIHARVPGAGNSRLNSIELPTDPYELLEPYIWTELF